ncbi:hypothetical protein C7S13_5280 [Burkholderia cepacia]|nr:hypothetical protein [Burkholderia cepacia]
MRTCSQEANDVCSFVANGSPKIDDLYPFQGKPSPRGPVLHDEAVTIRSASVEPH